MRKIKYMSCWVACFAAIPLLLGAAAPACAIDAAKIDKELARIVKGAGPSEPIAAAALAVMIGDRLVYSGAAGCAEFVEHTKECVRPLLADSKLRVASISKMALAMGLNTLVDEGKIDLDRDVSDYLGWPLRNPAFPDRAITARQLLSHTSSVHDPEEYWIAAPGEFRSLIDGAAKPFDPEHGPGEWFRYANLNYAVLAAVVEGVAGERFDRFMTTRLFKPAGLDIGYNWSGVSPEARRQGASLPQREGRGWIAVVDSRPVLEDPLPYFLAQDGIDRAAYLENYRPGDNPTLFSPQGGLRASVFDLVKLVRRLNGDDTLAAPVWSFDAGKPNGDTADGFYETFGLGVQTVESDAEPLGGARLIGHSGDAYGLHSGAWLLKADPALGRAEPLAFAFVSTGFGDAPKKGAHPTFNAAEQRLVRLALSFDESDSNAADDSGPQPFDEKADATSDIDAALIAAKATGKKVLIVFGGNWCHDSRGLAQKFRTPPLDAIVARNFELVWVDVGRRDRNLESARRFGIDPLAGTPTVVIVSPEGEVLNRPSVDAWTHADSKSLDETTAYFRSFAD